MNIIDINYEKLRRSISDYILMNNNELYCCCSDSYILPHELIRPIVLMNNETLEFLKQKNEPYIQNGNKTKFVPMIFDCYIAIAEWLSFGEVKLK